MIEPNPEAPDTEAESEAESEAEEVFFWRGPSKSQQKRDADKVADLGRQLTELGPGELGKLRLDPELYEAVELCRRLKKGAKSRQLRLIAKLLRGRETAPLFAAVAAGTNQGPEAIQREQEHQLWRKRMLEQGDVALDAFCASLSVEIAPEERRELRALLRKARQTPPDIKSQRSALRLLRKIRELSERLSEDDDPVSVSGA